MMKTPPLSTRNSKEMLRSASKKAYQMLSSVARWRCHCFAVLWVMWLQVLAIAIIVFVVRLATNTSKEDVLILSPDIATTTTFAPIDLSDVDTQNALGDDLLEFSTTAGPPTKRPTPSPTPPRVEPEILMDELGEFYEDRVGIVMCAFDAVVAHVWANIKFMQYAWLLNSKADKYRSKYEKNLTIQICHVDEISPINQRMLENLSNERHKVQVLNLKEHLRYDYSWNVDDFKGWECKPVCAVVNNFHHIISMDTDLIMMTNPIKLIETPFYHRYGMVLFKDVLWDLPEKNVEHWVRDKYIPRYMQITKQFFHFLNVSVGIHHKMDVILKNNKSSNALWDKETWGYLDALESQFGEDLFESMKRSIPNLEDIITKYDILDTVAGMTGLSDDIGKSSPHIAESAMFAIDKVRHFDIILMFKIFNRDRLRHSYYHDNEAYGDKEMLWLAPIMVNKKPRFSNWNWAPVGPDEVDHWIVVKKKDKYGHLLDYETCKTDECFNNDKKISVKTTCKLLTMGQYLPVFPEHVKYSKYETFDVNNHNVPLLYINGDHIQEMFDGNVDPRSKIGYIARPTPVNEWDMGCQPSRKLPNVTFDVLDELKAYQDLFFALRGLLGRTKEFGAQNGLQEVERLKSFGN